jgi:uncharacterized protein
MSETPHADPILTRIAEALERLVPSPPDSVSAIEPAYAWEGKQLKIISPFRPLPLALLSGIDAQRDALLTNCRRLAQCHAAHDVLLWGARGGGKSALVKSTVAAVQDEGLDLAFIEVPVRMIESLPALFTLIKDWQRPTIIFIDDLAFEGSDDNARTLRSVLEGGAAARPSHVRLAVTSNRRHIVSRSMGEQDDPINPRDVVDDRLALADRFGLSLGFHVCGQDQYLTMVAGYADHLGLTFDVQDALTWSTQRGARSGRIAWHYAVELAGRAGKLI